MQIDWNDSCQNIFNKIRAFSPIPSSFSFINKKRIKILSSRISSNATLEPGVICLDQKRMYVGTSSNPLEIIKVQPEGKKAMDVSDFINGFNFENDIENIFEYRE